MSKKSPHRTRLSKEEYLLIQAFRRDHKALIKECDVQGIPVSEVSQYWLKSENFSIQVRPKDTDYVKMRDQIVKDMGKYAPKYPTIKRSKNKDPHLLVLSPADIHIGLLSSSFEIGEDYNNQIAVQRVREGIQGILDKTSGYNFDKILFIIGNDILHIDTPKRTTTAGTPQDTDGMWYDNFLLAKRLYVEIIEKLLQVADVHIMYNPSNHDYTNGFFLADTIGTWFKNSKNVTTDLSIKHRKYFTYHKNLIGSTHGDGAKTADLSLLMAHEAEDWSKCKHRYFYYHHIHHKVSKDQMGVCVESLRTPSTSSGWADRNGYNHAPKAIEAFCHHPQQGQVARITHIF